MKTTMKTYDVEVNWTTGMEMLTVEAKSKLDAFRKAIKVIEAKQKVTSIYRSVDSLRIAGYLSDL